MNNTKQLSCRINFVQSEKLKRIIRKENLKNNTEAMKFLIDNYEDNEITEIQGIIQRMERKFDALEKSFQNKTSGDTSDLKLQGSSPELSIILKIVTKLAEANPRVLVSLKDELPELFG